MNVRFAISFKFQSTLPVGGATELDGFEIDKLFISIHAPRGGSDLDVLKAIRETHVISIHAPRGGSDTKHQ